MKMAGPLASVVDLHVPCHLHSNAESLTKVAGVFRIDTEFRPETTRNGGRFWTNGCGHRLSGDSVRRSILGFIRAPRLTPATSMMISPALPLHSAYAQQSQ